MIVRVPRKFQEIVERCKYSNCRYMAYWIFHMAHTSRRSISPPSRVIQWVVNTKYSKDFNKLMSQLEEFVIKGSHYWAFDGDPTKPGRNKEWSSVYHIDGGESSSCSLHPFSVCLCSDVSCVNVKLPFVFLDKLQFYQSVYLKKTNFDLYFSMCSFRSFKFVVDQEACEYAYSMMSKEEKDKLFYCGSNLKRISFCGGGRIYHYLNGCPKPIRRHCIAVLDEDGAWDSVVEVDGRSHHFFCLAYRFAPENEKNEIVDLIRSGKFYSEIAGAQSTDQKAIARAKKQALYGLYLTTEFWKAFKARFPVTANRSRQVIWRDKRPLRKEYFQDGDGNSKVKITTYGQRNMSRILTRMESKFFNKAISKLWLEQRLAVARINDAILCGSRHQKVVEEYLDQAFIEISGFSDLVASAHFDPYWCNSQW